MNNAVAALFDQLWHSYLEVTPSAQKIQGIFNASQEQSVVNDHVALRTFDHPSLNIEKLAQHFTALGYRECGEYRFEQKKLDARHFEHSDPSAPKVFISELEVATLSPEAQAIIHRVIQQVPSDAVAQSDFLYSGRHWPVSLAEYQLLRRESEYAAWVYVWGFRANHFTVSVNHLQQFASLEAVNETLKAQGFVLNTAGGEIKGSPQQLLEQSATMADRCQVQFEDANEAIPSCFYEFAKRYTNANGELYNGFIAASADKIFESTNNESTQG